MTNGELFALQDPFGGRGASVAVPIDDPNPLVTWVLGSRPWRPTGEPPTMFNSGDLPAVTASGVDAALLARIPWMMRHSAAFEVDRARVIAALEADAGSYDQLQNADGAAAWEAYRQRVWRWATGAE
jgi:hypothetical protein